MTGKELKKKLIDSGYSVKSISDIMGKSMQSSNQLFNVQDVKTGILEDLCKVLGKDMSFFYPEIKSSGNITNTYTKDSNVNSAEGNITISDSALAAKLLEELSELRKLNQKLMESNQKLMDKIMG